MQPVRDNPFIFTETQWFVRRWWWLIGGGVVLISILSLLATTDAPLATRLLTLGLGVLLAGSIALLRLDTRIDAFGIHYRYIPLLNRWRHWPWADFRQVQPRTYSPLGNFGGWGIKGWPGNLAYNVWGSHGLQLTFRSGDRLLLGTQRPAELAQVLAALGQLDK